MLSFSILSHGNGVWIPDIIARYSLRHGAQNDINLAMEDIVFRLCISLPGFLLGIVFHEWAHAYVATRFGDDTAKNAGRLTFNPAPHADIVGTLIFPMISIAIGGIMFGWAKPVPVDPRRFKNMRSGIFWVSFAGPLANVLLATILAFFYVFMQKKVSPDFPLHGELVQMMGSAIMINILLAVFNLIPFPPLDGSKMVSTFLDYEAARKYEDLQRFSFLFIILLWSTNIFGYIVTPAIMAGNQVIHFFGWMLG